MHGFSDREIDAQGGIPKSARFGRLFAAATGMESWPDIIELGLATGPMSQEDHGTKFSERDQDGRLGDLDNPDIPAAYTYLGQFIDHDLSFDATSVFEAQIDQAAVRNFRTASLELDCLYGSGPSVMPYLYDGDDRNKFLIRGLEDAPHEFFDVPRRSDKDGVPLLADPRNDENLIVSQLTVAFLRFHNAIVEKIQQDNDVNIQRDTRSYFGKFEGPFEKAQRIVRWHYQWLIVHDYLPKIVGADVIRDIVLKGRQLYDPLDAAREAFIPVEFSAAAFRFGHSQVQRGYAINLREDGSAPEIPILKAGAKNPVDRKSSREDLRGGLHLRNVDTIDWSFLTELSIDAPKDVTHLSSLINTRISSALLALPNSVLPRPSSATGFQSLAARNMHRGFLLSLPSGVSAAVQANRILDKPVPVLTKDECWNGIKEHIRGEDVPLWFYLLREAEVQSDGRKLGPLGARIVAEVIIGMLMKDPLSILNKGRGWIPYLGVKPGSFSLTDLLRVAEMRGV